MRDLDVGGDEFRLGKERSHVAVEMGRMDAHGESTRNLGADLALDIDRIGVRSNLFGGGIEGAIGGEKAGNLVAWGNAAPAVGLPFAGKSQVNSKVGDRMVFSVVGNVPQRGTRNHDAGG